MGVGEERWEGKMGVRPHFMPVLSVFLSVTLS